MNRIAAALLAFAFIALSSASFGVEGIISVNQHPTAEPLYADCLYQVDCAPTNALPLPDVQAGGTFIDAFSYHVNALNVSGTHYPLRGRFCKATCRYTYASRPKFVSDDVGEPSNSDLSTWLDKVCADDDQHPERRGRLHFEHWEKSLETMVNNGECVGGWFDQWPTNAKNNLNLYPSRCGTILNQNGRLARAASPDTDKLDWRWVNPSGSGDSSQRVTLLGFGFMGALAAGDRFNNPANFFHVLHWKHANLIRVWAIEQWTAAADPVCSQQEEGPTPFDGTFYDPTDKYDLATPNPVFYATLRSFVQAAADRGVVVQLSLFDKHGLLMYDEVCEPGHFLRSPYNDDLNIDGPEGQDYIDPNWGSSCGTQCNAAVGEGFDDDPLANCIPPPSFTSIDPEDPLYQNNLAFIRRVAEEIGGVGNVIYEIVNEAKGPQGNPADWPGTNEPWQLQVSEDLRTALPAVSVRDAFNADADGTDLNSKRPDARQGSNDTWTGDNAKVVAASETILGHDPILMGWATSKVMPTKSSMFGSLPFVSGANWSKLNVRADLTISSGQVSIGVGTAISSYQLYVSLDTSSNQIKVIQIGGCPLLAAFCTLGTAPLSSPSAPHAVRLRIEEDVNPSIWHVSVYLDGAQVGGLADLVTGSIGSISKAFFSGSNGTTPYPLNAGKIDNFEATYN